MIPELMQIYSTNYSNKTNYIKYYVLRVNYESTAQFKIIQ
jgi:hypothetical protein